MRIFTLAGAITSVVAMAISGSALAARTPTKQAPDSPDKNTPHIAQLRAGPIRMKFQDGELRYIRVGDKEIARRIYFGVRDGDWNTAMPKFSRIEVHKRSDSFTVALEADCRSDAVDYHWKGRIVGKPNGEIQYSAEGSPSIDLKSNRIGLCLLYGVQSLAGQKFTTINASGRSKTGAFPRLVSPTLVAEKFQSLRYTTTSGMTVTSMLKGATFDMEDQRNWGDSAFKAYAPLPYHYPELSKGDAKSQELTLAVTGTVPTDGLDDNATVHVTIGKRLPGAHVPALAYAPPGLPQNPFADVNMKRPPPTKSPTALTWGLNPSVHLPDDDMLIENLPTVVDQAATARTFAPHCKLLIAPVRIRGLFPDGGRDPRNENMFGGAWCAAVIKYLSIANVSSAEFDMGDGSSHNAIEMFGRFTNAPLYETIIQDSGRLRVEALAVDRNHAPVLFLINMTPHSRKVICDKVPGIARAIAFDRSVTPTPPTKVIAVSGGRMSLLLTPYEICEVRFKN